MNTNQSSSASILTYTASYLVLFIISRYISSNIYLSLINGSMISCRYSIINSVPRWKYPPLTAICILQDAYNNTAILATFWSTIIAHNITKLTINKPIPHSPSVHISLVIFTGTSILLDYIIHSAIDSNKINVNNPHPILTFFFTIAVHTICKLGKINNTRAPLK